MRYLFIFDMSFFTLNVYNRFVFILLVLIPISKEI